MKTITVKVTQEHIDKGMQAFCSRCPLALALRASGYPKASVHPTFWYAETIGIPFPLPKTVTRFIDRFDAGLPVRPQTFRLQAPEPAKEGL